MFDYIFIWTKPCDILYMHLDSIVIYGTGFSGTHGSMLKEMFNF